MRWLRRTISYRVWLVRRALGQGHVCDYTDPATGVYVGICHLPGMHRGRLAPK